MAEPRIMNLLSPLQQTGGSPRAAPSGGHTRERQEPLPTAESKQLTALKAEIQRLKAATNNRRDDSGGVKAEEEELVEESTAKGWKMKRRTELATRIGGA